MKGIMQGGIKVAGNSTRNLYINLVRNTTDFVLVGTNTFGLREFYPHLKRGKKESKPATKGMRRTKPPKSTKTATKTKIDKEEERHTTKKVQPEPDSQAVPKSGEAKASE
jgi:DNA-directed RNA polymerase delta subunit